jgi:hypothetical protein
MIPAGLYKNQDRKHTDNLDVSKAKPQLIKYRKGLACVPNTNRSPYQNPPSTQPTRKASKQASRDTMID